MNIESPVLGKVSIADDKVIEFPEGLPGFESCTRFALLHDEAGGAGLFLLHSMDEPDLMFSVTGPENLGVNYEFSLTDDEVSILQLEKPADAVVAVILRKEDGGPESPVSAGMRANFMAPLVINVEARRGLQKIINRLGCDVTLRAMG